MRELTPKQDAFVDEYLVDLNATAAADRAGYSDASYGRQLITVPHVQAAIQARKDKRAKRVGVTAEEVIEGLLAEARREGNTASHMQARITAWSWLGKHLGIFTDRHELSGVGGGPVEVKVTRRIIPAGGEG